MPPNSTFRGRWDMWLLVTLAFTAVVTPFEIAFLTPAFNVIFALNRVVDITFIIDITFTFFTPIVDVLLGVWVLNHAEIALQYMWRPPYWFWLDLISVIPFDLIALLINQNNIKAVRVFRLLRLLKLIRIFRASRILKKWEEERTWKYSTVALLKFSIGMLILAHWMACLMGLVPLLEGTRWEDLTPEQIANGTVPFNWYVVYLDDTLGMHGYTFWSIYLAGYYLAGMTLTTLGYGDVVAKTDAERGVMLVVMLVGASAYAYAVGNIFAIISSMDSVKNDHKATLDAMNDFMEHQSVPHELRVRIRKLFIFSLQQRRHARYKELLEFLSPGLRQEASHLVYHNLMETVPFVSRSISPDVEYDDFLASLAEHLTLSAYPPWERLITLGRPVDKMYIVGKGCIIVHLTEDPNANRPRVARDNTAVLVRNSVPLHARRDVLKGCSVGHEMVYDGYEAEYHATTAVYSEVHSLTRDDFFAVLELFPVTKTTMKKFLARQKWSRLVSRVDERAAAADEGAVKVQVRTDKSPEAIASELRALKRQCQDLIEAIRVKDAQVRKFQGEA